MKREYKPKDWQTDPRMIDTNKVQYWNNGVMLTAMMTKETAIEKVTNGEAFVITGQAIGTMVNGIATA